MRNIKVTLRNELESSFSKLIFRVQERHDIDIAHVDFKLFSPMRSFFRAFPY